MVRSTLRRNLMFLKGQTMFKRIALAVIATSMLAAPVLAQGNATKSASGQAPIVVAPAASKAKAATMPVAAKAKVVTTKATTRHIVRVHKTKRHFLRAHRTTKHQLVRAHRAPVKAMVRAKVHAPGKIVKPRHS